MDSNLLNSPQVGSSPVVLFHQLSTGSILTFTPNKNNQQKYTSTFKTKSLPISRLISGENRHPKNRPWFQFSLLLPPRFLFGEMSNLANYANYAAYVFFQNLFFVGENKSQKHTNRLQVTIVKNFWVTSWRKALKELSSLRRLTKTEDVPIPSFPLTVVGGVVYIHK